MSNSEINNSEKIRSLSKTHKEIILGNERNEMINSLAGKLGISRDSAQKLSELKTITNINALKQELGKIKVDKEKYDEKDELNEILNEIQNIQNLQKEQVSKSRIEIASLKEGIEKISEYQIVSNSSISSRFFGQENFIKIENGENIGTNLVGSLAGISDSTYTMLNYTKDLIVGVVKTPSDLYKIVTGKAEYDGFKNV